MEPSLTHRSVLMMLNLYCEFPRCLASEEDQIVWDLNQTSTYTVKSAYYYAMENLMDTSHLRVEGNQKTIWLLRIPNKIKILIWRIVRGCLSTRCRLQRKGVQCIETCPMCSASTKNEWHLFFGCSTVQQLWDVVGLWNSICTDFEQAESAS